MEDKRPQGTKTLFPNAKVVWSEILMRRYWHNAKDGKAVELARKPVNLAVKNCTGYIINTINTFDFGQVIGTGMNEQQRRGMELAKPETWPKWA
jgi:hypothetical protein